MDALEKSDYKRMIAKFKSKLLRLEEEGVRLRDFIAYLEEEIHSTGDDIVGLPIFSNQKQLEISPDLFRGLTVGQATAKYLGKMNRPVTTTELIDALHAGGLASTAIKWRHSLRNSIKSAKEHRKVYDRDDEGKWTLIG